MPALAPGKMYKRCTFGFFALHSELIYDLFVRQLKDFIPRPELVDVYRIALCEAWQDQTKHAQDDKRQISNQIKDLEERLSYLRELLATQKIDPEDYRIMKADYSEKIDKLVAKMSGFSQNQTDIDGLLNTGIQSLINLENLYKDGDILKKREIIGSIYPEKLTFDGFSYRTARLNEAVRLIYSLGAGFSEQKNRTSSKKIDLSCRVTSSGFKPETS